MNISGKKYVSSLSTVPKEEIPPKRSVPIDFFFRFYHLLLRRFVPVNLTIFQQGKGVFLAPNMHYYCLKYYLI